MICETCSFSDPLNQFTKCPVCDPNAEQHCPFLDHGKHFCRLDNTPCTCELTSDMEVCPKLHDV